MLSVVGHEVPSTGRPLYCRNTVSTRLTWFDDSDALAYATFKYSIVYLTLLFVVLFIDHYWPLARAAFATLGAS